MINYVSIQIPVQGVSVRCFFEASTNVPGYMSSGYRLLLNNQPQKRQSPGYPLNGDLNSY